MQTHYHKYLSLNYGHVMLKNKICTRNVDELMGIGGKETAEIFQSVRINHSMYLR